MVLIESGLYIFRDMELGFQKYYPGLTFKDRNGTFTLQKVNYDTATITLSDTKSKDILINCNYEEFTIYFKLILDYKEVRVPGPSEEWYLLYPVCDVYVTADNNKGWDDPSIYVSKNATPDPFIVERLHNYSLENNNLQK